MLGGRCSLCCIGSTDILIAEHTWRLISSSHPWSAVKTLEAREVIRAANTQAFSLKRSSSIYIKRTTGTHGELFSVIKSRYITTSANG